MTDRNLNSDKDTAYIQNLLNSLRASIAENEDEAGEGSNQSPTFDTPRTDTVPAPLPEEQQDDGALVPPTTPELDPLPEEEVPPVIFPVEEEVPTHNPEQDGANPTPDAVPPETERPLPTVDPFSPVAPMEVPQDEPVETPLVPEPAEFPRYEEAAPVEDVLEDVPAEEAAPLPLAEETDTPAETAVHMEETEISSQQARDRLLALLEEEPPLPQEEEEDVRGWHARRVENTGDTVSHPVGNAYRSFPVPDPTVEVPIFTAIPEPTVFAVEVDIPDEVVEVPVLEEPETLTPEDLADLTEQPLPPEDGYVEGYVPLVNGDGEDPVAFGEGDYATLPPVSPQKVEKPSKWKGFIKGVQTFFQNILSPVGTQTRVKNGFPFGVASIAHTETEEGKKIRKQEISRELLSNKIRCWFSVALLLILFLWEMFPKDVNMLLTRLLLTRIPGVAALVDLQLLLLMCFIGYRPILRGFAALGKKQILPETLMAFSAVFAVVGQSILLITGQIIPFTLGFLAGCLITAALIADYFRVGAMACAMRVYTLRDEETYVGVTSQNGNRISMDVKGVVRPNKFKEYTAKRYENTWSLLATLVVGLLSALIYFIVVMVSPKSDIQVERAIWGAVTVFCSTMPLSQFCVHSILFGMLSQRLAEERVGISDESVAEAFSKTNEMIFEDTDAFPSGSIQVRGIKLRGDFRMDSAMYLVASLFRRIGGPLDRVFRLSTEEKNLTDDVEIRSLSEDGIEVRINGEDVCVGSKEYLGRMGIAVYTDEEDKQAKDAGNAILCVAYRTQMCAKFYIHYEISPQFESNVEYYSKHGVSTLMYTADPMLTSRFLDKISYVSSCRLTLVKKDVEDYERENGEGETSGLISVGPRKTLRRMPFFFRTYVKCRRILHVMSCVAALVNGIAVPTMMIALRGDTFVLTPLAGAIFQMLWVVPTALVACIVARLNPNKPSAPTN